MKKVILTLIAIQTNLVFSSQLFFPHPEKFIEVDPVVAKQPAMRLFVAKEDQKNCTMSLHKQTLDTSFEDYMKNSIRFIESNFPLKVLQLANTVNKKNLPLHLYHLQSTKIDFDLEILQAYFVQNQQVFLLSYSATKKTFNKLLDEFHKILQVAEIMDFPPQLEALQKELLSLVQQNKIPFQEFSENKEVKKFISKAVSQTQPSLFEIRSFVYE
jgi:hypothetical protein